MASRATVQIHPRPESVRNRVQLHEIRLAGAKHLLEGSRKAWKWIPSARRGVAANVWIVRLPWRLRIGGGGREQDRCNKNFITCHDISLFWMRSTKRAFSLT